MKSLTATLTFKQDFFITVLNGFGIVLGVVILNGLMARIHGTEILGEYLLVRRVGYTLNSIFLVGLNVSLPFFIGKDRRGAYLENGIVIFFTISLFLISVIMVLVRYNFLPGFRVAYIPVYFIYFTGIGAQYIVYAYHRGRLQMIVGNILQLIQTAFIPLIMILLFIKLERIFLLIGSSMFTISMLAILYFNHGLRLQRIKLKTIVHLLSYGWERFPSFISQFILMGGLPLLLATKVSYTELAYFNSGISLVRLFLLVAGPLGIILLPRLAKALGEGRQQDVQKGLELLVAWTFYFGVIAGVSLSIYSPLLMQLWLGTITSNGEWVARNLLLATPFFMLTVILRSPIDAGSVRGFNSVVYSSAVGLMVITYFVLHYFQLPLLKIGVICFIIGNLTASLSGLFILGRMYHFNVLRALHLKETTVTIILLFLSVSLLKILGLPVVLEMTLFYLLVLIALILFILKAKPQWLYPMKNYLLTMKKK